MLRPSQPLSPNIFFIGDLERFGGLAEFGSGSRLSQPFSPNIFFIGDRGRFAGVIGNSSASSSFRSSRAFVGDGDRLKTRPRWGDGKGGSIGSSLLGTGGGVDPNGEPVLEMLE